MQLWLMVPALFFLIVGTQKMFSALLSVYYYQRYIKADTLLEAWEESRPFLWIGQCLYAQSLVYEMIVHYQALLEIGAESDITHLAYLYSLLRETPPDYDPFTNGSFLY